MTRADQFRSQKTPLKAVTMLVRLRRAGTAAILLSAAALFTAAALTAGPARAGDLDAVRASGTLRHLGIPYANFVTADQAGLDVELMQRFAAHIGVRYRFVETSWSNALTDLTGQQVAPDGDGVIVTGEGPVRGDILSTGFTILPWRKKVVNFSEVTFPTGVWLISRADADLSPITPTGDVTRDIRAAKQRMRGVSVLTLADSCLAPELYQLDQTGADVRMFPPDRDLGEMIPAVIGRMADATLMDVPVALIALEKWPGEIKVIGPVSEPQGMACAFSRDAPELQAAFNAFFRQIRGDGSYRRLMEKYYPTVFMYYPDFLEN